jgi:hypothetical protein
VRWPHGTSSPACVTTALPAWRLRALQNPTRADGCAGVQSTVHCLAQIAELDTRGHRMPFPSQQRGWPCCCGYRVALHRPQFLEIGALSEQLSHDDGPSVARRILPPAHFRIPRVTQTAPFLLSRCAEPVLRDMRPIGNQSQAACSKFMCCSYCVIVTVNW